MHHHEIDESNHLTPSNQYHGSAMHQISLPIAQDDD
jgi:hypothetical protein